MSEHWFGQGLIHEDKDLTEAQVGEMDRHVSNIMEVQEKTNRDAQSTSFSGEKNPKGPVTKKKENQYLGPG